MCRKTQKDARVSVSDHLVPISDFNVITVATVLSLSQMLPYQELKRRRLVVPYDKTIHGKVIFVSHQWTAFGAPDPTTQQLKALQGLLERMVAGTMPGMTAGFSTQFGAGAKMRVQSDRRFDVTCP